MSIRLEMLQVARLSPRMLGESAELVRDFLFRQQNADGGFKDREGRSDLYYTVFALDGLLALSPGVAPIPAKRLEAVASYLNSFQAGAGLDFIHLCCLARCRAALGNFSPRTGALPPAHEIASSPQPSPPFRMEERGLEAPDRRLPGVMGEQDDSPFDEIAAGPEMRFGDQSSELLRRIEAHRTPDGGYSVEPGAKAGSAYGCFLALGAYQDARLTMPASERVLACLQGLEVEPGGWANDLFVRAGSVPATAAAVTVLRQCGQKAAPAATEWLKARAHPGGGFLAAAAAPIPDLLSTAVALHALSGLQADFTGLREPCLDFVDSLWVNEGGFYGNWSEDVLDSEYTYYGLLALGHLSL